MNTTNDLIVKIPSFGKDGEIPKKHTGFGEDISPEIVLDNLVDGAVSIAIIMDDLDIPFVGVLNHWVIWNLPVSTHIQENIPYGEKCENGAVQGTAYGRNRYRGPKQPPFIKKTHRYRFTVYALDCNLDLSSSADKKELMKAMEGHVLQCGECVGWYKP